MFTLVLWQPYPYSRACIQAAYQGWSGPIPAPGTGRPEWQAGGFSEEQRHLQQLSSYRAWQRVLRQRGCAHAGAGAAFRDSVAVPAVGHGQGCAVRLGSCGLCHVRLHPSQKPIQSMPDLCSCFETIVLSFPLGACTWAAAQSSLESTMYWTAWLPDTAEVDEWLHRELPAEACIYD